MATAASGSLCPVNDSPIMEDTINTEGFPLHSTGKLGQDIQITVIYI